MRLKERWKKTGTADLACDRLSPTLPSKHSDLFGSGPDSGVTQVQLIAHRRGAEWPMHLGPRMLPTSPQAIWRRCVQALDRECHASGQAALVPLFQRYVARWSRCQRDFDAGASLHKSMADHHHRSMRYVPRRSNQLPHRPPRHQGETEQYVVMRHRIAHTAFTERDALGQQVLMNFGAGAVFAITQLPDTQTTSRLNS